jgi:hypothetical protein
MERKDDRAIAIAPVRRGWKPIDAVGAGSASPVGACASPSRLQADCLRQAKVVRQRLSLAFGRDFSPALSRQVWKATC